MRMRLLKSDFLTVPGSAILQYGGYYRGCMVKSLIQYKYSFFKLLKSKNDWHQWKAQKTGQKSDMVPYVWMYGV